MCRRDTLLTIVGALTLTAGGAQAQPQHALPAPWQHTDIGDVGPAGSAGEGSDGDLYTGEAGTVTRDDVSYAVHGAGADIWGTQDAFHYMYVGEVNDATLSVSVESLDNTNPFAKAGIMIRASTDPSAAHVIVDVKPDGGIEFMARSINDGETQYIAGVARSFLVRLQLQRAGSTVTAYVLDGYFGTKVGSIDIDLAPDALIGLAVTSHERGTLAIGIFFNVNR